MKKTYLLLIFLNLIFCLWLSYRLFNTRALVVQLIDSRQSVVENIIGNTNLIETQTNILMRMALEIAELKK